MPTTTHRGFAFGALVLGGFVMSRLLHAPAPARNLADRRGKSASLAAPAATRGQQGEPESTMRFDPWMIGLTFAGAAGLAGCGGGSSSSEGDGASPAEGGEARGETHFAVEGRGESAKATTVLDVVEG